MIYYSNGINRQYSVSALLIFLFASSVWCLPCIGFLLPNFANRILNLVASDNFLLILFDIF